jgi:hypothetical protein
MGLVLPESVAILRSLSSVAFRACRNCENVINANKAASARIQADVARGLDMVEKAMDAEQGG